MRTISLSLLIAGFAFTSQSFAQSEASATSGSSATIVTPIAITNNTPLSFGTVAVTDIAGTVVLDVDSDRTASGGITLPTTAPGTVSAAEFTVTGEGAYGYEVTLPTGDITLTETEEGTATMVLNGINGNSNGALVAGTETFNVGGTLNVQALQAAGTYENTTDLVVLVVYN